ncbi:SbcC/MukB-like Walker B domain-containing protein [Actinoplanes sichuanensis]|uniref:SbcC/MukB-like Walker B domain-containing protein n=1 Tax=Actinoplanes sichuanensis TaxID=512349 RepID=A0ABW4A1D1_9ACTN
MTATSNPAATPDPEDITLGVPVASGRWQPTRAGAVNSWAWSDETFLFADGWLALAGPNGSGKSLTASTLVTLLLDANARPKALSVSGEAAGTLTDRHTNRNPREDRTGAWWLEYGRRDDDGTVQYLTTGLWLRAVSGDLHVAYFLTPSRIGTGLQLQADREPLGLDAVAAQLAACGGQLFTDSARLTRAAGVHLSVGKQDEYKTAVRTTVFAPLDEVQFDALVGVLRSLRSVRTAEAISPNEMRRVLTEALPALDPSGLAVIAESMERIADFETQLKNGREQTKMLQKTETAYIAYTQALTRAEAAGLIASVNRLAEHTRNTRQAEQQQADATIAVQQATDDRKTCRDRQTQIEGRLAGIDAELRNHAGADLPHLEQRLADLRNQERRESDRAQRLRATATQTQQQSSSSADAARDAQRHLADLSTQLQATGSQARAEAVLDNLMRTATDLAEATPDTWDGTTFAPGQLVSTPLGWTEVRTQQIQQVDHARQAHNDAQQHQLAVADELRRAETEQDHHAEAAEQATTQRQNTEQQLRSQTAAWDSQRIQLPGIPATLIADDSALIDPEPVTRWLENAARATRDRIDVSGHKQSQATSVALDKAASSAQQQAATAHDKADTAARDAAQSLLDTQNLATQQRAAAQAERTTASETHDQDATNARQLTVTAQLNLRHGEQNATDTAMAWAQQVAEWRTTLVQLPADAVPLPPEPNQIDLPAATAALHQTHARAEAALQIKIAEADRNVTDAKATATAINEKLTKAHRADPIPPAPPWRPERPQHGGAALWSLVDFAPHLPAQQTHQIEGALRVAGLLDAWISADGTIATGDLTITADTPATGASLADLLTVEDDPSLPAERVLAVLKAIAVDADPGDLSNGHLQVGVLTAVAPLGYEATYIGRTARERARLALVAQLQQQFDDAQATVRQMQHARAALDDLLAEAAAERDRFPNPADVRTAREQVDALRDALRNAERETAQRLATAQLALQQKLADITALETAITTRLTDAQRRAEAATAIAQETLDRLQQANAEREQASQNLQAAQDALNRAESDQRQADTERQNFPFAELEALRTAIRTEDLAHHDLGNAEASTRQALARLNTATGEVSTALRQLHTAAALPDGTSLPITATALKAHLDLVTTLASTVRSWHNAAERTADLLAIWRLNAGTAATAHSEATTADNEAETVRLAAERIQAQVEEIRKIHGTAYEELRALRESVHTELQQNRDEDERLVLRLQEAGTAAAAAQATLKAIAPQRQQAEQERDHRQRRIGLLVTHHVAELPDDLPADQYGLPANITAAISWSRRILAAETTAQRHDVHATDRDRALTTLESAVRTANQALAKYDQQVNISTIDGPGWRRVTLAAVNAAVGDDLFQAITALRAAVSRLEVDLREDLKATLKNAMLNELRRDIRTRRELARELVRQIRETLAGVRTGVERVGVEVDWLVRKDSDAQRMIELLGADGTDDTFDQMYEVLRKRMDDASDEAWNDRVAHAFDYRSWHQWDIRITHRTFGGDGPEVFREVNARSNPLKSLSTGEARLATMLPLLAAAWSMYSGDGYRGPRLLSIDEIDAAFDEPNLRQIFNLLRGWNFDVLATTPSITPMIKREVQQVVIHQLVAAGRNRVTVPWLWRGHGEPQPLTLDFTTTAPPAN